MKIESITLLTFAVKEQSDATAWRSLSPSAEALAFVFYGHIPTHFAKESVSLRGVLSLQTDAKERIRLERESNVETHSRTEHFSAVNEETNTPYPTEILTGDALFGADASLFLALSSLGTAASIPEYLSDFCKLLLSQNARKEEYFSCIRRIDEASSSLLHPNERGGAIYELEKKLKDVQRKLDENEHITLAAAALKDELCQAEREKAETNAELQKLLDLESAYGNLSLIREYDELHAFENALDDEKSAYEAFLASNRVGTFLPTDSYSEELSERFLAVEESVRAYASERTAYAPFSVEKEYDFKYEEHLALVQHKYGGFDAVRRTASVLARRAAHTTVFSFLALCSSAFFFICTLLAHSQNPRFALALLLLALCSLVSAPILLHGRRRFIAALLILCREFGAKNNAALLKRLRFLEEERARIAENKRSQSEAKERLDHAAHACTSALEQLNAAAAKWGRAFSPTRANEELAVLLEDVRTFLANDLLYRTRIEEKSRAVALARKALSNRNELTVRALVSPVKRENLRLLEKENRLPEIAQGIAFYKSNAERTAKRIAELQSEHAALSESMFDTAPLKKEKTSLSQQIADLRARHLSYALLRRALFDATSNDKKRDYRSHYMARLCGEAATAQEDSIARYLALASFLLPQGIPFAVDASNLTKELRARLSDVAQEESLLLLLTKEDTEAEKQFAI